MRNDIVVIVDPSFIGGITCFTESSVHGNDFVASHSGAFLPGIFCSSTIAAFASKCSIMQIHPSKYETNCQKSTITFYGVLNKFLWRAQRQQTPKTFRGNKPGERTRRTQFQLTKQTNSAQKKNKTRSGVQDDSKDGKNYYQGKNFQLPLIPVISAGFLCFE